MWPAVLLFLLSLLGLVGAINALRQPAVHRHPALRPPWLPALLTAEAVPIRIVVHGLIAAVLIWAGALDHLAGRVGLAMTLVTWVGYAVIQWRAAGTKRVVSEALSAADIDPTGFAHVDWQRVVTAYPYRMPAGISRLEDIEYASGLRLDVYRRRDLGDGLPPALLYVHGGFWRGGNRRQRPRTKSISFRFHPTGWVGRHRGRQAGKASVGP